MQNVIYRNENYPRDSEFFSNIHHFEEFELFYPNSGYLHIFILVAKMLGYKLDSLCGLVGLRRKENIRNITRPPLAHRGVVLEGLTGVQLTSGIVHVTQLHHLQCER